MPDIITELQRAIQAARRPVLIPIHVLYADHWISAVYNRSHTAVHWFWGPSSYPPVSRVIGKGAFRTNGDLDSLWKEVSLTLV